MQSSQANSLQTNPNSLKADAVKHSMKIRVYICSPKKLIHDAHIIGTRIFKHYKYIKYTLKPFKYALIGGKIFTKNKRVCT
jgi:hypothetical protein